MKIENQSILPQDYEYALQALNDLQFRQSKNFSTWLSEESHRVLFQEMMNNREALMNLNPKMAPDIDKAWQRMPPHTKRSFIKRYYIWAASVAAIALLLVGYTFFSFPEQTQSEVAIVLPASDKSQEVTLQTDNGLEVAITDKHDKQLIAKTGAQLEKEALNYQNTASETVAMHTLSTPRGKNFKIILEDGTEVWLNAESKLRYPARFTGKERIVELEGEAFFHVTKNPSCPFIVKSGSTETRVLGTEFNFRVYPNEDRHVTLVSGSIVVSDRRKENELKLIPGQDAALDAYDQLLIARNVDLNEFTAWKDDLFCFRETELLNIMKAIGRWYNITIVFADNESMHYHFNFWAERNEGPEQVIKLLNDVGKVKATLENNKITISKL